MQFMYRMSYVINSGFCVLRLAHLQEQDLLKGIGWNFHPILFSRSCSSRCTKRTVEWMRKKRKEWRNITSGKDRCEKWWAWKL